MPAQGERGRQVRLAHGNLQAALEHLHKSTTQGLDDTHSGKMSDLLVIWRGAVTAFDPKCFKHANEAKLLMKEKNRRRRHYPTTTS